VVYSVVKGWPVRKASGNLKFWGVLVWYECGIRAGCKGWSDRFRVILGVGLLGLKCDWELGVGVCWFRR